MTAAGDPLPSRRPEICATQNEGFKFIFKEKKEFSASWVAVKGGLGGPQAKQPPAGPVSDSGGAVVVFPHAGLCVTQDSSGETPDGQAVERRRKVGPADAKLCPTSRPLSHPAGASHTPAGGQAAPAAGSLPAPLAPVSSPSRESRGGRH